ncbi:hypothetical protein METBIDRAFT_44774 [Metschnikowia bicuspidata var. bicuspidata NRRL YB-4993]|uniref:EXS domain-containing protein n=1 Tax=Metschnikowia bicuspidata var. bicuspidata NRRL YB-4993 TaxID=869754 RepID=A0A1A0H7Z9_9ASCO|nr:hypothetical protein METBIDRAFT_44774 [Metschnikowia bicuspidata var. bicuspidata NRRL YB-4993]OBA20110.1 hypothetical protein METBIDRAFT_44774 [Metschnikowia bicuspidata var. bicuspidata NRRL YB-4993]
MIDRSLSPLTFDDVIPLPHRVAIMFQLGVFLFYSLVWVIYNGFLVNCLALLNFAYSSHKFSGDGHDVKVVTGEMATVSSAESSENMLLIMGIRKTFAKTFTFTSSGLVVYWTCLIVLPGSPILELAATWLPACLLLISLYTSFRLGDTWGQNRVNATLKRVLVGRINSATMRTNDILLSDTLTSYSKVINDFASLLWVMLMPGDITYNNKVEALVLSYPALLRMKQCWYEFKSTRQRQHLLNMCKYLALLGPVLINLLIKINMGLVSDADGSQTLNKLNRWWYVLLAFSSMYLFIWDIKMDWGFEAFDILFRLNVGEALLLRSPSKLVCKGYPGYYLVILFDFVIRFIWVFKVFVIKETEIKLRLQNHVGNFLFGYDYLSLGYAILEFLEIFRRWLWCFIKLESDLVKLQLRDDFARATPLATLKLN